MNGDDQSHHPDAIGVEEARDHGVQSEGMFSRSAIAELLAIAIPSIAVMTSYSVMQTIDKLVVKELGPDALSAVGNGGIAAFVPGAAMMGLLGLINTFVSQNVGANKPERAAGYAWAGIWISIAVWVLVMLPFALGFPWLFKSMHWVFGLEPYSPAVMEMQTEYGVILILGLIFVFISRSLSNFFYGIHQAKIVLLSSLAGNIVNVVLCYGLVLGKLGLPELGVKGAAISTVVGGVIEAAVPTVAFLTGKTAREFSTRAVWRPRWINVADLFRKGWSAALMSSNEILCWFIFLTGFVASFDAGRAVGESVNNAAGWITLQFMHLSFMPSVGMSIAIAAVVGKQVGAKRLDLAASRAWLGTIITIVYMTVCAAVFVVFREDLVGFFLSDDPPKELVERLGESGAALRHAHINGEIIEIAATLLILAAGFQFFDAIAIAISGALRGAGDAVWPGIVTVILSWVVIVGGGWITVQYFNDLGSLGPWIAAALYIIALAISFLVRFLSGKWRDMGVVREDVTTTSPPIVTSEESLN